MDRIVVLDHGSYTIKAGYVHSNISAEADLPPLITPTRVRVEAGKENEETCQSNGLAKVHSGELMDIEIENQNECSPIKQGVICNWEQMESLWHYILYEQV